MGSRQSPDEIELEAFKRQVNLTEYAAAHGYALDRKGSSRNSATMRHPAGDKIVITVAEDKHWTYFSVRDAADHGTIIDFVRRRGIAGTLGDVRKELRPWAGGTAPPGLTRPPAAAYMAALDHIPKDLVAVRVRYAAMEPIDGQHAYLEGERQIPLHVLTDPLFCDCIRADADGNAIFPHANRDGVCGYEIKGRGVTRFSKGGVRGLWFSGLARTDTRLVIAESAVDALSYAALHYKPGSRYLSTAGEISADQATLLKRSIEKMPDGSQIVLAVDNDPGGNKIGARIEAVFGMVDRPDLTLTYDRPATAGADWNDVIRTAPALAGRGPRLHPRPR